MAEILGHADNAVTFLGVQLGHNVEVPYSVEEDTKTPPGLTLTLRRAEPYLVLDGDLAPGSRIDGGGVAENIAHPKRGLEDALVGRASGVMNGIRMSGTKQSICTGYMVLRFTRRAAVADTASSSKDPKALKKLRDLQRRIQLGEVVVPDGPAQDLVLATAYNITREDSKQDRYDVQAKGKSGSQVHVEQILAYKLRAFLDYLSTLTVGHEQPFNLADIDIAGHVAFSFSDGTHTSKACEACEAVWKGLRQKYPSTAHIEISKD